MLPKGTEVKSSTRWVRSGGYRGYSHPYETVRAGNTPGHIWDAPGAWVTLAYTQLKKELQTQDISDARLREIETQARSEAHRSVRYRTIRDTKDISYLKDILTGLNSLTPQEKAIFKQRFMEFVDPKDLPLWLGENLNATGREIIDELLRKGIKKCRKSKPVSLTASAQ